MSAILKAIAGTNEAMSPIRPMSTYTPPKPATGAQTQQAVAPVAATSNVQPTTTQVPDTLSFSDTLKKLMSNAGLKSEFENLLAKVK